MAESEHEVKQAVVWRLEAEAQYQKSLPRRVRIWAWFVEHILAVVLGALIGAIIGAAVTAGWDHIVSYKKDRATRSAVLYESLQRVNQVGIVYNRLNNAVVVDDEAESVRQQREVLQAYQGYIVDPLSISPFGTDPKLKDLPDVLLVNEFRAAGGDDDTAQVLSDGFSKEAHELGLYLDAIGQAKEATLAAKRSEAFARLSKIKDSLLKHPDLTRLLGNETDKYRERTF